MRSVLLTLPPLAFGVCLELKMGIHLFMLRRHFYGNANIPEIGLRWNEHLTSTAVDTSLQTDIKRARNVGRDPGDKWLDSLDSWWGQHKRSRM